MAAYAVLNVSSISWSASSKKKKTKNKTTIPLFAVLSSLLANTPFDYSSV